jgi:uncharacterized protein (UPF0248 family)
LREWQKEISEKLKGHIMSLEAKFIARKTFLEHGFEVYIPIQPILKVDEADPMPIKVEKDKKKESFPAARNFKKIKGSNPAEVRRQFLEHNMEASISTTPHSSSSTSGKLRTGKDVLNRIKFDEKYDIEDFVVGYIDRKEGIIEKAVQEWENFAQEELMAYIRDVKRDEIVWDKARKVDIVFGTK